MEELITLKIKDSDDTLLAKIERLDLIFGVTYVVSSDENLEGKFALHPITNKLLPIYRKNNVDNYLAVPAHNTEDYNFAKEHAIEIIPVIQKITGKRHVNEFYKESIVAVVYDPKTENYLTINWGDKGGRNFIGGTKEPNESDLECAIREIREETGYVDLTFIRNTFPINHHFYAYTKDKYYEIVATGLLFELNSYKQVECELDEEEIKYLKVEWASKAVVEKEINEELFNTVYDDLLTPGPYLGEGRYRNSDFINDLTKDEAVIKIREYLEENNLIHIKL